MTKRTAICVAGLLLSAPVQAQSETKAPAERFEIERTEHGIVRLDRQTGAMTLCRDDGGNLVCRMAADERAAYEDELDRLAKRVTALEERLGSMQPKALPSDEEVERTLSLMERFMRRFMAIIGEPGGDHPPPGPQPNRT
jgi:hypothetical protein